MTEEVPSEVEMKEGAGCQARQRKEDEDLSSAQERRKGSPCWRQKKAG